MAKTTKIRRNVVSDDDELSYIVELFNKDYQKKEADGKDMDCDPNAELSLIRQPKSVTYTTVDATPMQHRVLVETIRCLQPYMSKSAFEIFTLREKFNFMVNVDFSTMEHFREHLAERETFLRGLQDLRFTFGWKQKAYRDADGVMHDAVVYEYSGYIYIGHLRRGDSSIYGLHVNPMALPYLLFIGKDMHFTEFDYNVYLRLNSVFSQELYIKICDWSAQGTCKQVTVEELKKLIGCTQPNISEFTKRVLDATRDQLFNIGSEVIFDYQPIKEHVLGRKKSIVGFEFYMSSKLSSSLNVTLDAKKRFIEQQFMYLADPEKRTYAKHAAAYVVDTTGFNSLVFKFSYYLDRMSKGEIREEEYKNIMRKIVRESYKDEFGKPMDLRSELHIRNSMRRKTNNLLIQEIEDGNEK